MSKITSFYSPYPLLFFSYDDVLGIAMDKLSNGWKVDIFGCCSPDDWVECLVNCFCPCVSYAHIVAGLGEVECCCEDPNDLLLQAVAFFIPFNPLVGHYWARTKCHEKYGIEADVVWDFVAILCCGPCSWYQMLQQTKA